MCKAGPEILLQLPDKKWCLVSRGRAGLTRLCSKTRFQPFSPPCPPPPQSPAPHFAVSAQILQAPPPRLQESFLLASPREPGCFPVGLWLDMVLIKSGHPSGRCFKSCLSRASGWCWWQRSRQTHRAAIFPPCRQSLLQGPPHCVLSRHSKYVGTCTLLQNAQGPRLPAILCSVCEAPVSPHTYG